MLRTNTFVLFNHLINGFSLQEHSNGFAVKSTAMFWLCLTSVSIVCRSRSRIFVNLFRWRSKKCNLRRQDILKCNHYIQFKLPVQFGAKLLPISLPEKEDEKLNDGTMCFVTGWRNTLVSWDVCDKVKYLFQQKVNYSKISNFFELYIITQYDVW